MSKRTRKTKGCITPMIQPFYLSNLITYLTAQVISTLDHYLSYADSIIQAHNLS